VLMSSLQTGDLVLTTTLAGVISKTTVLSNQHAASSDASPMLTFSLSNGATLSLTPDHGIFIDGALVAAAAAKVGSILSDAKSNTVVIESITMDAEALVINPVTAAGTILASSEGEPLFASSHPIWVARAVLKSPVALALVNAGILYVGDASSVAAGVAYGVCKLLATFAVVTLVSKARKASSSK
jgi:hypothetical protein